MPLTPEQSRVAQAMGPIVRVTAYAGTGKTSSLVAWAEAHQAMRALYVAFNKSVQVEARARFPRSVTSVTGHALAWRNQGALYRDKLVSNVKPAELVQAGLIRRVPFGMDALWADVVWRTVQAFLASADETVLAKHVPLSPMDWQGPFAWADPHRAVVDANRVWQRMQDPHDRQVGMVHDGYLKLFVLSQPRLPYDVILFDEAQDANPVLLQLMQQQKHARQLFVGDPLQAIYGWRGAVNAMAGIQPDQDLRLTASFRFGPHIAAWATAMLQWFDGGLPPLRGLGSQTGQVYRGIGSPPATFVARSNARLFAEAVGWLDRLPNATLSWVGGIDGYRLDWLADTARLYQQESPGLPFLKLFPDFDSLKDYADTVEDVEWQGRCRAVERWGNRLPSLIHRVRAASRDTGAAPIHLATIHKAKGLEWPHVVVLDDLAPLTADLTDEDHHLWYVAMTRATERLGLPDDAVDRLTEKQRKQA